MHQPHESGDLRLTWGEYWRLGLLAAARWGGRMASMWGWLLAMCFACAQPAQVILLRHGEEPGDKTNVHLSARGEARALGLATLLGTNSVLTTNAPVAAVYAARVSKNGRGYRSGETMAPLGKALGLPVSTPCESDEYRHLIRAILHNKDYSGKTVVVCWTHEYLPDLAQALGVTPRPPPWRDKVYDRLWIVRPKKEGPPDFQDVPQRLLKNDAKR